MDIHDQLVKDAFGALAMHALRNADDISSGFRYDCPDLTIGNAELGNWTIAVKRNSPPKEL